MGRIAIYGLLSCLIILTAYLFITRSPDESLAPEIPTGPKEKPLKSPVAENPLPRKHLPENPVEPLPPSTLDTPAGLSPIKGEAET
jgi:hypothetical protein